MKKPHIVIFNPDQFRADALGHLGNAAHITPNLDALCASDGVSFSHAFCQNPVCTPSRCSFMSGWYPHVRGHRTMFNMMKEDEPVLLRRLKDYGYHVWWGGKNDLIPGSGDLSLYCDEKHRPRRDVKSINFGFERARGEAGGDNYYSFYMGKIDKGEADHFHDGDWENVYGAIDLIRNAPADKPLCLYLPLTYPHPPYAVEEPWYSAAPRENGWTRTPAPKSWDGKPLVLSRVSERQNLRGWTEERWAELRATYLGMCARIDYQFGILVQTLKDAGIYDDTAIFVFSDHGDFTGDYGLVEKTQNTFEDCLTRVPFLIKPPSWITAQPGVRGSLVELVDFVATVEEMTGLSPDYTHFGKSLVPIIKGEVNAHRDTVFTEGGRLPGETHCMETKSTHSHDPRGEYWPRSSLHRSEGAEPMKAVMVRTADFKYVKRFAEQDELYDLRSDPHELVNRINDAALKSTLADMKDRLIDFYISTCDVVPHVTDDR